MCVTRLNWPSEMTNAGGVTGGWWAVGKCKRETTTCGESMDWTATAKRIEEIFSSKYLLFTNFRSKSINIISHLIANTKIFAFPKFGNTNDEQHTQIIYISLWNTCAPNHCVTFVIWTKRKCFLCSAYIPTRFHTLFVFKPGSKNQQNSVGVCELLIESYATQLIH